jgi:penicillin-insensitive murein endopeptidase
MKKFLFSFALLLSAACQAQSVCYGTPANGALSRSVQLQDGENFEVYRWLEGRRRLFVHIDVQKILIEAFDELQKTAPGAQFVIGEASFQGGGHLPGHKTHQNGTSVDLFVPVREAGALVPFLNDHRNGYGYKTKFDADGRSLDGRFQVDFELLAEYIYQLKRAAEKFDRGIDRVVLSGDFQQNIRKTERWRNIRWVRFFDDPNDRHDNHIHVDFDIPCKSMWSR